MAECPVSGDVTSADDATGWFDDDTEIGEEKRALHISVEKVYFVEWEPLPTCTHLHIQCKHVSTCR